MSCCRLLLSLAMSPHVGLGRHPCSKLADAKAVGDVTPTHAMAETVARNSVISSLGASAVFKHRVGNSLGFKSSM